MPISLLSNMSLEFEGSSAAFMVCMYNLSRTFVFVQGPVADSWLFYGGYVRESFCESNSSCVTSTGACEYTSCSYRIDIAYMIMIFVSLFGPFFILSWR